MSNNRYTSTTHMLEEADRKLRTMRDGNKRKAGEPAYVPTAASAGGSVEGYAATFHREPDSYGDVIARGAFADTLRDWKSRTQPIPLLYGHVTDNPKMNIGKVVEAHEDATGLFVRAEFDPDSETAQYVRKLAAEGRIFQFSFAYQVRDQGTVTLPDGTRANELRKLDLFEVSLVQIPANQHAVVTGVKDTSGREHQRMVTVDRSELELLRAKAEALDTLVSLGL